MAMVNQMTGARQGIANAVLYPLSTIGTNTCNSTIQQLIPNPACIFYHTTKDNDAVPCVGGSPNCSAPTGTPVGVLVDPQNTLNPAWIVASTAGYDRATGLGTINAFNLVTNWNSIHFESTQSSLTILGQSAAVPNPVVHGSTVGVTVNVTSGGGTPTGTISLVAGPNAPPLGLTGEQLSNGTVGFGTNLLPGGTYTVTAQYSGDSTFAPSNSNGVSITVTKESSVTTPVLFALTPSGSFIPTVGPVQYGSPYILRVEVTNNQGHICLSNGIPCPTGTVALTDSVNGGPANPLNDFDGSNTSTLVNGIGFLEDHPIQLSSGNHSFVASYQGDLSFTSSVSTALAITVTKASSSTTITGFPSTIASGTPAQLTAFVDTVSNGVSPSGTVSFFEGSTLLGSANVSSTVDSNGFAAANATLTTSLSGLPLAPMNPGYPQRFFLRPEFFIAISLLALAFLLSTFVLPKRRVLVFLGLLLFSIGVGVAGCGGGSTSVGPPPPKMVTITATYNGDTNYTNSSSTSVSVTVN
jgi:hypothetical protein